MSSPLFLSVLCKLTQLCQTEKGHAQEELIMWCSTVTHVPRALDKKKKLPTQSRMVILSNNLSSLRIQAHSSWCAKDGWALWQMVLTTEWGWSPCHQPDHTSYSGSLEPSSGTQLTHLAADLSNPHPENTPSLVHKLPVSQMVFHFPS